MTLANAVDVESADASLSATTDALFAQVGGSQSVEPESMGGLVKPSGVEEGELDLALLEIAAEA